jgi:hypothetical protein
MKKTKIDSKLYQLTLEKMVIGLEEPILIKGVGEIIAKVDSGNGGYNVIHGEDLTVQGDIVTFKTVNKDGDDRRVSKKIKETINVNIGGGHIQERPVIELDVQFGGQDYKKILFSVTDRSGNDNKVLISKDFVGKELDALIDVTKNKIADDGIEVEYVSEGIGAIGAAAKNIAGTGKNITKGVWNTALKTPSAVASAISSPIETYKKISGGLQKGAAFTKKLREEITGEGPGFDYKKPLSDIEKLKEYLKNDAEIIKVELEQKKGKGLDAKNKVYDKLAVVANKNHIQVYKILDWMGGYNEEGKYVDEQAHKQDKENIEKCKKVSDGKQANPNDKEKNKDTAVVKEAAETKFSSLIAQKNQTNQQQAQGNNPAQENNQQTDANQGNNVGIDETALQSWAKNLYERRCAILYFAAFTTNTDGSTNKTGPNVMGNAQPLVVTESQKILKNNAWDEKGFGSMVKTLAPQMGDNVKGVFVLRIGKDSSRTSIYFTEDGQLVINGKNEKQEKIQEYSSEYKTLSNEIDKIKKLLPKNIAKKLNSIDDNTAEILKYVIEFNKMQEEYKKLGGTNTISEENLQTLLKNQTTA